MAKVGRPSEYNQQVAEAICERIALGESLRSICRDDAMPAQSTVFKWLTQQQSFAEQYARARETQADAMVDEMLDIADRAVSNEEVQAARLRIDARKWVAVKLRPKKYGERVMTELTGRDGGPIQTEDVGDTEAARRIAFTLAKATQPTTTH